MPIGYTSEVVKTHSHKNIENRFYQQAIHPEYLTIWIQFFILSIFCSFFLQSIFCSQMLKVLCYSLLRQKELTRTFKYFFFVILSIQIINNFQLLAMISSSQTLTQNYTKVNGGQYTPNNLAVCGVRCLTCNQYYEASKIQEHLISHVNPQHIKTSPAIKLQTPTKHRLSSLLQDPEKIQDIQVKSFLPSELPCMQVERRRANVPLGLDGQLINVIEKDINKYFPDKVIPQSTDQSEQFPDQVVQQINLKQKIALSRSDKPIHKKQLNVYMNESKGTPNVDIMSSKRKKLIPDSQTQQSDGYKVMQAPTEIPKLPLHENRRTYQIDSRPKNPIHSLRISTLSRKPEQSTILNSSRRGDQGGLACPHCQGFYCHHCKSSIPPIYRPVPDSQGNYHFHPQQHERSIQFMQSHYYPLQQPDVCTICSRNMQTSRQTNTALLNSNRHNHSQQRGFNPFENSPQRQ